MKAIETAICDKPFDMKVDKLWEKEKEELIRAVVECGFPKELGDAIVKNIGWPKAMHRMTMYLRYTKPTKPEIIVDEMLAIREEILVWQEKKASLSANAAYNTLLSEGLNTDDMDDDS